MPCMAIDLFCGIGGLTKGLSLAGIDVLAGFDIDESCQLPMRQIMRQNLYAKM